MIQRVVDAYVDSDEPRSAAPNRKRKTRSRQTAVRCVKNIWMKRNNRRSSTILKKFLSDRMGKSPSPEKRLLKWGVCLQRTRGVCPRQVRGQARVHLGDARCARFVSDGVAAEANSRVQGCRSSESVGTRSRYNFEREVAFGHAWSQASRNTTTCGVSADAGKWKW